MNEKAEEVYKELFRQVNGPAFVFEKTFKELFSREHSTLQQAFIRHIVVPALEILVSQNYDARNKASHDFAVEALKHVKGFPTI